MVIPLKDIRDFNHEVFYSPEKMEYIHWVQIETLKGKAEAEFATRDQVPTHKELENANLDERLLEELKHRIKNKSA